MTDKQKADSTNSTNNY